MDRLKPPQCRNHFAGTGQARAAGISRVYGLGELAHAAVDGFAGPGSAFDSLDQLLDGLHDELRGPLHILVKGSRRMRMERVVDALIGTLQPDTPSSRENH